MRPLDERNLFFQQGVFFFVGEKFDELFLSRRYVGAGVGEKQRMYGDGFPFGKLCCLSPRKYGNTFTRLVRYKFHFKFAPRAAKVTLGS